ncbi:MAG: MFS transporter [Clostridia bacterium]|nr:MFS transporter [Clostridia bacterium]
MNILKKYFPGELKTFYILWITQALSALGSAMTSFALVIWLYEQSGQALMTALLSVCSYAPYVIMSIFAGALSDRWDKRKTMIACDGFAALCTCMVLVLLKTGRLLVWHLYVLNALNGLMNTFQQPASEIATTLLTERKHDQRVGGLKAISNSLTTLLTPVFATAMFSFGGLDVVIAFDLITCAAAIGALWLLIRIPKVESGDKPEPVLKAAKQGIRWLNENKGILNMILFLAAINLIASMYNAALPAMVLSREGGGRAALGWVNACTGAATLIGSLIVSSLPAPKKRAMVICNCLLISMSTENLILALGRNGYIWCFGAVLGWLAIPVMNVNLNALFRSRIPVEMQGRVYSARNTLQFFTIPLGYLLGGALVDRVCEPLMASLEQEHFLSELLGTGKGTGAALLFLCLAALGVAVCLYFRRDRHIRALDE